MIPINLSGAAVFLRQMTYDKPVALYSAVARKVDALACHKRMTTGHAAFLTFPLSIMFRNAARMAHETADGRFRLPGYIGGVASGITAFFFAAKAVFTALSTGPLAAVAGGKALAVVLAGVAAAPVALPAFTLGVLATATFVGAAVYLASGLPAAMNFPVGCARTMDAIHGRNLIYDDPAPALAAKPAVVAPPPPPIDPETATTLNDNLTFKKVKISFKNAGQPPEAPAPGVKEFKPGDALGARKTITL